MVSCHAATNCLLCSGWAVLWLWTGAAAVLGQEGAKPGEKAVPTPPVRLGELPERFFQIQDEAGFFWQALDNGALISGDTQYLQSCLNLIVDGEPFAPKSGQVREPGTGGERIDLRLEEARATYAISRDVWFDTGRSGVRVFDVIRNTGNAELRLPVGCDLVGVELLDDAVDLPSFRHPPAAAYILGPERGSLSPEIQALCDFTVKIPMKFCVNVGVAGAIVMYDRLLNLGRFAERPLSPGGPSRKLAPPPAFGAPLWERKRRRRHGERGSG